VSHLVAFGLYGATLFFYELWRTLQADRDWKNNSLTFLILMSPATIIFGYFLVFSGPGGSGETEWDPFPAFLSILHSMNGFNAYLSFGNILALIALLYFMFRVGRLSIMPQGKWIAVGFLVLMLALPFRLFGGDLPSLRVGVGALLILPAFLIFAPTNQS